MSMTWYEYNCVLTGHIIRSMREWEHTRMVCYYLYAVNTTEKKKKTPHEMMPLLTDKVDKVIADPVTGEERQRLIELAQSRANLIPLNRK
jgi:hypothetical protein